jgi:Ca-activated chloride channel family protein
MNKLRAAAALLLGASLSLSGCSVPEQSTQPDPKVPEVAAPAEAQRAAELRRAADANTASAPRSKNEPAAMRQILSEGMRPQGVSREYFAAPSSTVAPTMPPAAGLAREDRERYGKIDENPVKLAAEHPVSTFSIDVDTGAYANVRRFLSQGRLPPHDAVRVEELVNYFPYDYALPKTDAPFAVHTETARAPWNAETLLLRIAIKGQDAAKQSLPPASLVFLVDVSGSMMSDDKLPLAKESLRLLVNELRPQDRVSLVTYASGTQVVLEPTAGSDKATILAAIERLRAGGSTAGAGGIQLAYAMAQRSFMRGGINRILLATDGDFNVGITDFGALKSMVADKRKSGVSLSTLGFGTGNYNEHLMEQLADAGDGAYSYIDSLMEGRKVLVNEMTSTLATIARDVKIQVEFNPALVREYRLIGYENRLLNREDFNNDNIDAGDIGAGHTVTALYEITPIGAKGLIDDLRYRRENPRAAANELAHVKLRYTLPESNRSTLMQFPVAADSATAVKPIAQAGAEFRFAAAVAGFGQLLRGGKYTGTWSFDDARRLAASSRGADPFGYRAEFSRLIDTAAGLSTQAAQAQVQVSR